MRHTRRRATDQLLLPAAFLATLLGGLSCEDQPGKTDHDAESGVAQDSTPPPDVKIPADAGSPDAGEPPVGVPYEYCSLPFFKLHIGGPDEEVAGLGLWDGRLVYSRGPKDRPAWDVYLLSLTDCLEYKLTGQARATTTYIRGDEVFWSDNRAYQTQPEYHCKDIYRYDLSSWTEEQLTDDPLCEWSPQTNGRFLVFERSSTQDAASPHALLLWDRQEGTTIQLSAPGTNPGYHDITDRYLAWSGYTDLAGSLGKDVFYLDLVTGEETHVPNSASYYCYDVYLWGEYLSYLCSEYWVQWPWHLFLHHIPTGEELHLEGGEEPTRGVMGGAIHEHLIVFNTTRYGLGGTTAVLYDIETGVQRRLTSMPSYLVATKVFYPWVVFILDLGSYVFEYYIANLEALEVVDATGHLTPGDPVIDPPL
ncbi:MAG: hypothetical protein RBU30_18175 [Polyangia bacterium]|jgi:hypothetical protein|nr:hypothetical protein [Polyangia bacterium]